MEDAYLPDVAFILAAFDVVVDLEGLHEEDDDAAGEVLQGALQGHTDGQTHSTEEGDEGGGLDAYDVHSHEDDHSLEQQVDQRAEEAFERGLGIALVEGFDYGFTEEVGHLEAQPQHQYGRQQFGHKLNGELGEGAQTVLHDSVLAGNYGLEVIYVHALKAVLYGSGDAVGGLEGLAELVLRGRRHGACIFLRCGHSHQRRGFVV